MKESPGPARGSCRPHFWPRRPQLVEEGRVQLTDSVSKFLPATAAASQIGGCPEYWCHFLRYDSRIKFGKFHWPPSPVSITSMYASLSAAKSRLSKLAEALLADHVGMMAPILVEEVFSLVAAAKPQNEQLMLAEFFVNLRKLLPAELNSEKLINSLCARYEQD